MRIAIIGQNGQLARALIKHCAAQRITAQSYSRADCDLSSDPNVLESFIDTLNVDGVIIAAAYTGVDAAEEDYDTAFAVNAVAPAAIARACARREIALVHVSTDYVFKGEASTPYTINAPTDPINAYGRTKLAGETGVLSAHTRTAIVRTSWVFDGSGKNFMTTMLRLAETRDSVNVVADQIGRPSYAPHLAAACIKILQNLRSNTGENNSGLYHVTNSGPAISWAEFATAIFKSADENLPHDITVNPIPTQDYPTPAKRPAYSVLDLSRFETLHGALPDWRDGLEQAYKEWSKNRL